MPSTEQPTSEKTAPNWEAIEHNYSAQSAAEQAYDLLRKPQIKSAIEAGQKRLQGKLDIKAENVVRQLALIATADPRELIEVRVGCGRCCHGMGHKSQRTELEIASELQRWELQQKVWRVACWASA